VTSAVGAALRSSMVSSTSMTAQVRFCTSADGTRIAYSVAGSGPPVLFLVLHNSDAELTGPGPGSRHWIEHLTARHRVLRFDVRGAGLSDRAPSRIDLPSCLDDLDTVVASARFERYSVVALGYGVALALAHAAARPESVDKLVLYGGALRGRLRRDLTPAQRNDVATILTVLASAHDDRPGYGFAFRRMFYEQFFPDAPLAFLQELDRLIVGRFSSAVAHAYAAELFELDQTALASRLAIPTLVFHAMRDQFCSFEEGQRLAATTPNARFVAVDSNHSLPLANDPDWPPTAASIDAFLTPDAVSRGAALTVRQREVLRRVADGLTDKQIARELGLSHRTVEMHVARSLEALGCRSRAEAVARSGALGLL